MEEKVEYSTGFAFSFDRRTVVLIRKNRPQWQAGLLNGVGGKIEAGETPEEAMRREFREEAGLDIERWDKFLIHESPRHIIHCYKTTVDVWKAVTMTDEPIERVSVAELGNDCVPNILWMVPLALDQQVSNATVIIR